MIPYYMMQLDVNVFNECSISKLRSLVTIQVRPFPVWNRYTVFINE